MGAVQLMSGVHHFVREGGGGVAHKRHVIAELHREPGGRFNAGIGQQPDYDHMRDAFLLQQEIQVGIGEAALPPMLLCDEVAGLRRKVRVPFAAPFAARKTVALHDQSLSRVGMVPILIIARFPAPVRDDHHLDISVADGAIQSAQVIE